MKGIVILSQLCALQKENFDGSASNDSVNDSNNVQKHKHELGHGVGSSDGKSNYQLRYDCAQATEPLLLLLLTFS